MFVRYIFGFICIYLSKIAYIIMFSICLCWICVIEGHTFILFLVIGNCSILSQLPLHLATDFNKLWLDKDSVGETRSLFYDTEWKKLLVYFLMSYIDFANDVLLVLCQSYFRYRDFYSLLPITLSEEAELLVNKDLEARRKMPN